MISSVIHIQSKVEMEDFGIRLGAMLLPGDCIALNGDLGCGKTTLTKAIGKGIGLTDNVSSPTFNLIHEYHGAVPMHHIDAYRLTGYQELYEIGFEEILGMPTVLMIEWADRVGELLPDEIMRFEITNGSHEEERFITIDANGERYEKLLECIIGHN